MTTVSVIAQSTLKGLSRTREAVTILSFLSSETEKVVRFGNECERPAQELAEETPQKGSFLLILSMPSFSVPQKTSAQGSKAIYTLEAQGLS